MDKLKRGHVRDDGKMFWQLCKKSADGTRARDYEYWVTPERFKELHEQSVIRLKRRNKKTIRNRVLSRNFGITLHDYNKRLADQFGVCAICGKRETMQTSDGVRALAVDHCHNTGRVRGLLCSRCNTGIGSFEDDVTLLQSAISYLQK